jgi:hypothetical protein
MINYSKYALLFSVAVFIFFGFFYYPKWQNTKAEATISWDVSGYYTYLPAIFIYQDLQHCAFVDSLNTIYQFSPDNQQLVPQTNGNVIIKYPIGQAIMMAPFFGMAHFTTTYFTTKPADGYSYWYQLFLGVGVFCYAIFGLILFRTLLLQYFTESTTAVTIICIALGSNLLNYGAIDQCMTHAPLFMLYSALLLRIITVYKKPITQNFVIVGLLYGLMVIIRPTEIIAGILICLWGVSTIDEFKNRCSFIAKHINKYLILVFVFIIVLFIQLLYWKIISNHWIVYSYTNQGFNFLHPYWRGFLFSARCGWLRYCPIMLITIVGFCIVFFQQKNRWAILLFSAVNVYIICSWDIWWFGGRAMVQSYVVMSFALAAIIQYCNASSWLKYILYIGLLATGYINIWWTINAHGGKILVADVTKGYFMHTYGRWKTNDDIIKLLDNEDWCRAVPKKIDTIFNQNLFADSVLKTPFVVNKEIQYSPVVHITANYKNHKWLRLFVNCTALQKEWDQWKMCQLIYKIKLKNNTEKINMIRMHRFIANNETKVISFDVLLPTTEIISSNFEVWNAGGDKQVQIKSLCIIAFDE